MDIEEEKAVKVYYDRKKFVTAKKAVTSWEKSKGLMFKELEKDQGLLLVFKEDKEWTIWMLFVPQDLSVFFLAEDGKVVDKTLAPRLSFSPKSWSTYSPGKKCRYILEAHPDRIDDIDVGEALEFEL